MTSVRPFLLIQTRDHDAAAAAEYGSVLRHGRLRAEQVVRLRAESAPLPPIRLADYSGIMLGGSSFNISDPVKSEVQRRVETELASLVQEVLAEDFPFLGMCYGVGAVTSQLGGVVTRQYGEPVGAISVHTTPEGDTDPLVSGLGPQFRAFVGHKEACQELPPGAVLLGAGEACPVQMYRTGENVYVTQFHPELDADELAARMRVYQNAGYFEAAELDDLVAAARASGVDGRQHVIVERFVSRYAR